MVLLIIKYVLGKWNIFIMKYIQVTGCINYESDSDIFV